MRKELQFGQQQPPIITGGLYPFLIQISFSKMMNENCLPFQSTYIHARCSVGFVLLNLVSYVLPSGPFIIGLVASRFLKYVYY
jgi:hypothetical protein